MGCAMRMDKRVRGCRYWVLTALLISHFSLFTSSVAAQDDPEYRMEVGGGVALTTYLGDFNANLTTGMQGAGALVAKYKMNPRMAFAATMTYGRMKGSSKDTETWYPETAERPYSFSNQLIDLTLRYEYNFWAYGTGREYYGAKPVAPFIALGLGFTYADAHPGTFAASLPVGAGVKVKLGERLNLSAEWMMHFTGTDRLDGVKDPYGIKSSGLLKNTDCFSAFMVALTYDIWEKCKTCNNDR